MAAFDISAFAKGADVLSVNTAAQGFEMIRLELIDPNPLNFFEVEDDLTDLVESIQVSGLMQPLVVCRAEGGRYRVIAGHRRRAALLKLHEADPKRWELVACHVLPELSPAMEELILIQTNTMAREIDYPTRIEAVRRTEAALKQYQEDTGTVLPGRMRARVAELLKMSEAAIARIKAIDKNLIPELKGRGLSENQAYAIQKLDPKLQECLTVHKHLDKLASYNAESWAKRYKQWADSCGRGCKHCSSDTCRQGEIVTEMLTSSTDAYKCCGTCCYDCGQKCSKRCQRSRVHLAHEKAKQAASAAADAERRKRLESDTRALLAGVWTRIGERMMSQNVNAEELSNALERASLSYSGICKSEIVSYTSKPEDYVDGYVYRLPLSPKQWIALADALDVGLDWLLGREVRDVPAETDSIAPSGQTNYDAIKAMTPDERVTLLGKCANRITMAMTPDEMADAIWHDTDCAPDKCPAFDFCDTIEDISCRSVFCKWLAAPAKEDSDEDKT